MTSTTDLKVLPPGYIEDQASDAPGRDLPPLNPNQVMEAYRAALGEHRMSFRDSFRIYKKALFWSTVMAIVGNRAFWFPPILIV